MRWCLLAVLGGLAAAYAPPAAAQHTSRDWTECKRCRTAYRKAMDHTVRRLRRAKYPAKMIMGWLFLADGRHEKELEHVVDEAMRWRQAVGERKPHNHRRNWYPALAGMLLAEYGKHRPSRKLHQALGEIVAHFVEVQERTGGWYKWYEGAYKDRLDYPVKDLGILDAIVYGFLSTVRAQGVGVPPATLERAEACIHALLSRRGISYGSGSRGGDITGARGAFALNGLLYARDKKHEIARIYAELLPRQIPNMDKGHHVGALHCLGVTIGCHLLGPRVYRQLTDRWLDPLIDKQQPDGGIYVGDDGDAGGERKLLGEDDASTAAAALLILLQDPSRLMPGKRPRINWLSVDLEPASKRFARVARWGARGKLGEILALVARAGTEEAAAIKKAVEDHARARLAEAGRSLEEFDLVHALEILEPLAKTLARHEVGASARGHLDRIRKDQRLGRELTAQRELEKAWQVASRKGLRKARPAFEQVVKRFPDTAAAARAQVVLTPAAARK